MSNAIFPTFPGLAWSIYKTPEWSTSAQRAVSGKEIRMANRARPVWLFSLSYEILRGASVLQEYQKLLAFYNARQGSFDSFLFNDTSDNTATAQVIGTGDGARTSWPLLHQIDSWSEPVGAVQYATLMVNGTQMSGGSHKNLLSYSENFGESGWEKVNATAVTGISAPDGSFNAWAITATTSDPYVDRGLTLAPGNYTFSVFLRGTGNTIGKVPSVWVWNILSLDGFTLVPDGRPLTNGWVRYVVTFTVATAGTYRVRFDVPDIATVGDVVHAWGAQLEIGATATSYDPTANLSAADFTCADGVNVTFTTPPPAGSTITWSGTFYYRMRFDKDTMEFEQFMRDFWALKKCDLRGVI